MEIHRIVRPNRALSQIGGGSPKQLKEILTKLVREKEGIEANKIECKQSKNY